MNFIFLASLVTVSVYSLFAVTRQFQMLQQNSYFPSRYFGWVKTAFTVELAIEAILFCISSLLFGREKYLLQLILILFLFIIGTARCFSQQKKSIKKLVFTARVKRLYIALAVFYILLIALYVLFYAKIVGEIATVVLFSLCFVSPLAAFFAWIITAPIEKAFQNYYINDAKKILKSHHNLTVVGITGSYGKTTTKFILNRILSEKYNVVCTPQSFNTPMGVVRTVRESLKPQTQIFICEMGAKNIGDIKEICDIAHPDYGIITSVGAQHLETFKSVDNVYKTKFELADAVELKNGEVFICGDSEEILSRTPENKYTRFGINQNNGFRAENITYNRNGSNFDLVLKEEKINVTTKLLGLHSVCDIVAAAAVAYTLGVKPEDIKFAVSSLKPTEHRLELKSFKNSSLLIDDAYNANPVGCIEAVHVLGSFDGMKKTIITPGLIELGDKEYDCNFALGVESAKYCDKIILVGENRSKPLKDGALSEGFNEDNLYVVKSFAEAMQIYLKDVGSDSIVLLENDLPDNYLN